MLQLPLEKKIPDHLTWLAIRNNLMVCPSRPALLARTFTNASPPYVHPVVSTKLLSAISSSPSQHVWCLRFRVQVEDETVLRHIPYIHDDVSDACALPRLVLCHTSSALNLIRVANLQWWSSRASLRSFGQDPEASKFIEELDDYYDANMIVSNEGDGGPASNVFDDDEALNEILVELAYQTAKLVQTAPNSPNKSSSVQTGDADRGGGDELDDAVFVLLSQVISPEREAADLRNHFKALKGRPYQKAVPRHDQESLCPDVDSAVANVTAPKLMDSYHRFVRRCCGLQSMTEPPATVVSPSF